MIELNNRRENKFYEKIFTANDLHAWPRYFSSAIRDFDKSNICHSITGYADEPILPLIEACAPLINIVPNILTYATMALESTPDEPADGLTHDESASIRLYTMEWENSRESLYSNLNHALKKIDLEELHPWFKYLKLFLTALVKIPCKPPQTVWRGVRKNVSTEFRKGTQVTWWAFTSTTVSLTVLEENLYLGKMGERTLFSVEAINGRSIRAHSHYDTEEEVLLLPGTYMEVQSQFNPATDLYVIHLKQMVPKLLLLEPPFEGASIYPKLRRPWYIKKRFFTVASILAVLLIVGTIVGSLVGIRHATKNPVPTVNWNGNNWAFSCDFRGNDLINVAIAADLCGPQCVQTPKCTHFTWTQFNGGTCYMKTGNVSKDDAYVTSDPSMVCGIIFRTPSVVVNTTVSWNGNDWATSCDFFENDLGNSPSTPQLCSRKCAATEGCTHFVWSRWNGGTCFMKEGNVSKSNAIATNDPTMVCGIMNGSPYDALSLPILWNGNAWARSCDFMDHDLTLIRTTSTLCAVKCSQTEECTHYSWSLLDNGTCFMKKDNVSKDDAFFINDPNMVCGVNEGVEKT